MQANRNQTEQNRLEWFYAIEWEGIINFEEESFFAGWHKKIVETERGKGEVGIFGGNNRNIFLYIKNRIETGIFKINDAIEIEARKNNISTILNDFSIENGLPHLIASNTVVIEPLKNGPDNRRGITIFPANYLIPPKTVFEIHKRLSGGEELNPFNNYLARKILICVANQTNNKSPALKTIRNIAKVIILTEKSPNPTDAPPAPDAAAPVETGTKKRRRLPAGFREIKDNPLSNDRGEPVEMEPETLKKLEKVLPYIQEVKKRKTLSNHHWKRPDDNSSKIQPGRNETIIIEHKDIRYRIIYARCEIDGKEKHRFGVRIYEITKNGTEAGTTYFFFTGRG